MIIIFQHILQMEEIRVLELFSGIGGMHRAVQLAGKYLPGTKLKVGGSEKTGHL